jgi:hypothetical protein
LDSVNIRTHEDRLLIDVHSEITFYFVQRPPCGGRDAGRWIDVQIWFAPGPTFNLQFEYFDDPHATGSLSQ